MDSHVEETSTLPFVFFLIAAVAATILSTGFALLISGML